jgi:tripartite-type tricarboxylate transporter receptor subunit TctC
MTVITAINKLTHFFRAHEVLSVRANALIAQAALLAFAHGAMAQDFPSRPVKLVVGFPAGGGADLVGRQIATQLSAQWGVSVTVENIVGDGGNVAATRVAAAAPDGYTLMLGNPAVMAINPALLPPAKSEALRNLVPVALVAKTSLMAIVPASSPARSLKEFLELAKKYPASYNYGSGGTGNINHVGVELLKAKTGTRFVHTPGNSSSAAIEDLANGSVQFMMDGAHTVGKQVRDGKLRVLAVFGERRSSAMPNVPTVVEAGLPADLLVSSWMGLVAPKGTPAAVIDKVQGDVAKALETPKFRDLLIEQGTDPAFQTAADFGKFVAEEKRRWAEVVKVAGITLPSSRTPARETRIPVQAVATKVFAVRGDRAYLDGKPIKLWGIRAATAMMSPAVTERYVRNLDNMAAHGLNSLLVYVQGGNTGWPVEWGARDGFTAEGALKPELAARLEWLIREADKRGMVVGVGIFTPRGVRLLPQSADGKQVDEAVVRRALTEVGRFLVDRKLNNVYVDLMHEYGHVRVKAEMFAEPGGPEKKAKLFKWFKAAAPSIPAGVCPTILRSEPDFPGADIQFVQKIMQIPPKGYVINCELWKRDNYDTDGMFDDKGFERMYSWFEQYKAAPNAGVFFHSGFTQGVTGGDGAAPYGEMGGYGTSADDRGVRFYYEWVRDNVGVWKYPNHVASAKLSKKP